MFHSNFYEACNLVYLDAFYRNQGIYTKIQQSVKALKVYSLDLSIRNIHAEILTIG